MTLFSKTRSSSIIAAAGVLIAALLWHVRMNFPFDDTYITFRYAANIAHGYGIVWNPGGPHTEGYTNFLYVMLLTPFSAMGWDLVLVSHIINVIAVIVTALAIAWMSDRVTGYSLIAVALLYLNPMTWANAFTGMETVLFTMFVILALCNVGPLGPADASLDLKVQRYTPFLFATLATLARPEGAMLGAIILILSIAKDNRNLKFVIRNCLLFFVLPLVLYAAWKLWYFGDLLPNSFYVKVAHTDGLFPGRGPVRSFIIDVWWLVALGAYAIYLRRTRVTLALAAWAFALTLFFCFVQPLQGFYDRFENSAEVCLIALVPIAALSLSRKLSRRTAVIVCTLFIAATVSWNIFERGMKSAFNVQPPIETTYSRLTTIFRSIPDHEQITFCWSDAGELPYKAGMRHLDPVGLNTTAIAHMKTWQQVDRYIAAARPDIIFVPFVQHSDSVLTSAHGLVGAGYPTLMQQPELATYTKLTRIFDPWMPYELVLYVDTASVHYADIKRAFTPLTFAR